jgi:hypothetical protein
MTTTAIPPPLPGADERGQPSLRHAQTPRPRHPPRRYTRAIASFDNLVVLANYEEHLREARKMVWRDRGEPAVEVHDLWECLEHGLRGGLRASRPFAIYLPDFQAEDSLIIQELVPLPSRFVLASISSFYWHVSSVPGRCLGLSRDTCQYSLECHADHVHAGRRVSRLYNMRSLEQTRSVLVPCSVCRRFSDSLA